jgi:hypothetical protein
VRKYVSGDVVNDYGDILVSYGRTLRTGRLFVARVRAAAAVEHGWRIIGERTDPRDLPPIMMIERGEVLEYGDPIENGESE